MATKWEARATEHQMLSFSSGSLGSPLSVTEERVKTNGNQQIMLCVLLHHGCRWFPLHHYSSVNLGFPIKRDHGANVKYTLCVERLIKYWLQTYMNLPHQIEAPVGGLPLICSLIWIWVYKAAGAGAHYIFPVLLIYLFCCHVVPSHCKCATQNENASPCICSNKVLFAPRNPILFLLILHD